LRSSLSSPYTRYVSETGYVLPALSILAIAGFEHDDPIFQMYSNRSSPKYLSAGT
jgi:hypothetical protein